MPASKPATHRSSHERPIGSDLARVDAHEIQPHEYEELPELTDEMIAGADTYIGERLVRRGRPPSASPKQLVSLRLDPDVLAGFRATGAGWQSRINAVLREWLAGRG